MNWFVSFLFAILRPALGLIILAGLLLYWVLKKKFPQENFLKFIIYIFSGAIIFQSIFSTILNWWLWSKQGITQQLLPPHSPIAYVLKYSWQHYLFEPVITILSALIIFKIITSLNKKFNNVFFYDEEPYLASFGILVTGWPNCLIYLSSVLVLGILFHFLFLCFNFNKRRRRGDVVEKTVAQAERAWSPTIGRRSEAELERSDLAGVGHSVFSKQLSEPFRLSLLYFWLPCALLVLLLSGIISKYITINQLVI